MNKPTLNSSIILGSATVDCKFRVNFSSDTLEVTGFLAIRTGEFTPELVGSRTIQQFVADNELDMTEFRAQLQNMVTKNLNWV